MEDKISKRRGRPSLGKSRKNTHTVRFDAEEEAMLRHMEIEFGISISDIIRKSIRMFYNFKFKRS